MDAYPPAPDLDQLHRYAAYHAVVQAWSEPVGLACSGGIDSTALLLLAVRALRGKRVSPFVVLHVDHRTRPETRDEQRFVACLARQLGVPFAGIQVPTSEPPSGGDSPEAILRERRYAALATAVDRLGLSGVATAHTLDDQVETVLMRLLTGSGSLAATGMEPATFLDAGRRRVRVLRPLLGVRRADLEQVLAAAGVEPRFDPSNADPTFRRNALRHEIMPKLREIDPGFDRALLRSVELASRDARFCDEVAEETYPDVVDELTGSVSIDRNFLKSAHPAIANRILRRAIGLLIRDDLRELSFERVESVRAAASGRTGAVIELPGNLIARIERGAVIVSSRSEEDRG